LQEGTAWYALRVMPRHEKTVSQVLRSRNFEEFVPLYTARHRWADRYKTVQLPLFAGYAFCRFDVDQRSVVLQTPGVIEIVRCGKTPSEIPLTEIAALQQLMQSGLMCEPWPYLEVGERVQICGGPLSGLVGLVAEIRRTARLVLSVTLLQRSVMVELDRDWVRPERRSPLPLVIPPDAYGSSVSASGSLIVKA
jgi:transcription antitermination factor NusG